jgi:hypothetical protein
MSGGLRDGAMTETLAQERREHYLTIEMGNLCGQPTSSPGGTRATSVSGNVTCEECRHIIAKRGLLDILHRDAADDFIQRGR